MGCDRGSNVKFPLIFCGFLCMVMVGVLLPWWCLWLWWQRWVSWWQRWVSVVWIFALIFFFRFLCMVVVGWVVANVVYLMGFLGGGVVGC